MKPRRPTALLLIVTIASFGMAQQVKLEDPPWIKEVASQRILYTVPGMEKIRALKDLTYKSVADGELKMDVYKPPREPPEGLLLSLLPGQAAMCPALMSLSTVLFKRPCPGKQH